MGRPRVFATYFGFAEDWEVEEIHLARIRSSFGRPVPLSQMSTQVSGPPVVGFILAFRSPNLYFSPRRPVNLDDDAHLPEQPTSQIGADLSVKIIFVYGFVVGVVCFLVGFVGPIIFLPDSNQGPLLGIFITGPLGFIAGIVIGFIYSAIRSKRPEYRDPLRWLTDRF